MRKLGLIWICALTMTTAPAFGVKSGEQFKQWSAQCVSDEERDEEGGAEACHIFQELVVEQDGENKKAVRMSVGYAPGEDTPVTVIRLPLGLWLTNGIVLTVDEGEGQQFPVQVCAPAGCQTTLRLQPDMVETLKSGQQLIITTFNTRQQPVQIPIDLRGFSAALKALKQN